MGLLYCGWVPETEGVLALVDVPFLDTGVSDHVYKRLNTYIKRGNPFVVCKIKVPHRCFNGLNLRFCTQFQEGFT